MRTKDHYLATKILYGPKYGARQMTAKKVKPAAKSEREVKVKASAPTPTDALEKLRILVRTAQRHSAWIKKQCGVTGAQLWLMKELHDAPDLQVGELAERLAIHQTTTSNMLNALARRKLVVKRRGGVDQRVVTVSLTKEGALVVTEAPQPARGVLPEALRNMDKAKLRDLTRGLQALLEEISSTDETFGKDPLPFTM
jgi:DNA-binding MarR family transcriptional regulator